jgi:diadenosine tetraphosphatase ApaH/serine/threonine PP2A family protein phosphatase
MRVAILSDIHGNREAFQACLDHARLVRAEGFVLLGDYVGYGADPVFAVETVADLVARGAVALKGNHDAAVEGNDEDMNAVAREAIGWTRRQLDAGHRAFLAGLPLLHEEGAVLYVHANGYAPGGWDYVTGPIQARRSMDRTGHHLTICGHVHVPALYHLDPVGKCAAFVPTSAADIPLLRQRQWLAVMGAVGQPRDGNPAAAYGLYDTAAGTLRFLRVPYDAEAAGRKILAAGLPERLALRLQVGR